MDADESRFPGQKRQKNSNGNFFSRPSQNQPLDSYFSEENHAPEKIPALHRRLGRKTYWLRGPSYFSVSIQALVNCVILPIANLVAQSLLSSAITSVIVFHDTCR